MSVETNKAVIRQWLDAANRSDRDGVLATLTDDFEFVSMHRSPEYMKLRWDRDQFANAPEAMSSLLEKPIQLELVGMIAEGDKVAVEARTDSRLRNGKIYDNAYHLMFELRDGKIREMREYSCSHLAASTFGGLDPNDPESSKAAEGIPA